MIKMKGFEHPEKKYRNFLYRKKQSVLTRLYRLYNHCYTREKMKKIISLLFIVILALSSASCTDKGESSDKKKLEDAKFKYLIEIILENGSDEFISLLSIKYDLNAELTRKIIDEFIREDSLQNFLSLSETKTVEEFERLKTKFNRPPVGERIRKISIENNVEQSKIASLLIDYKIWYEAQHDETY